MARGHGQAVYGYGWAWFKRCLRAADATDKTNQKLHRIEQVAWMINMRLAIRDDKGDIFQDRIEKLLLE